MAHTPQDQVVKVEPRNTRPGRPIKTMSHADILASGLFEISRALTAPTRLETTLANFMNVLSQFMEMVHGAIVVLDGKGEPQFEATVGSIDQSASGTRRIIPQVGLDQVVGTGTSLMIPDISKSQLFQADFQTRWSDVTVPITFIGVPVRAKPEILGHCRLAGPATAPSAFDMTRTFAS
ncbi:GAF domain-containing protein [Mesorhizobium carmichaelinearum]|uniref:GAF domain-containing protein n=1 Tax=Mesorhizobium carmichaelinearum TaxID=1208188 RepID=UPI000BA34F29